MVNYGTSVIDASVQGISGSDLFEAIRERAERARSTPVDNEFDDKGCKVAFTYSYPLPQAEEAQRPFKEDSLPSGPGYLAAPPAQEADEACNSISVEAIMAERLQALEWKVVAIDFPIALPFAHNKIMAMSRTPIHTWMNAAGRRAVLHVVDTLMDHYDTHCSVFQPVKAVEKSASSSFLPVFFL
jgi:hypothetical protein